MREAWEDELESMKSRYNELDQEFSVSPETGNAGGVFPGAMETGMDMAAAGAQAFTLEWADDAIESTLGAKAADRWRAIVADARKRSPNATLVAELLTPNVLDFLTMGAGKSVKIAKFLDTLKDTKGVAKIMPSQKLDKYRTAGSHIVEKGSKGAAHGAATDAAIQTGEGGEYNVGQTVGSGALGGVVGGLGGLGVTRHRMRADKAGLNEDVSGMSIRTGGDVLGVDEYNQETAQLLEDMEVFGSNVKYDRKTGKFAGKGMKSNLALPPSDREILKRVGDAKKGLAEDLQDIINKEGSDITFTQDDFFGDMMDIINNSGLGESDRISVLKKVKNAMGDVFKDYNDHVPLSAIHDLRKKIDKKTKFSQKRMKPLSEEVYRKMGTSFRNKVRTKLKDTPFAEINEKYSRLSDVTDSLGTKLGKGSDRAAFSNTMASKNEMMQGMAIGKALSDKAEGVGSQISETMNRPRKLMMGGSIQDASDRGARKAVPYSNQEEEINEPTINRTPQSIRPNSSMMRPQERMEMTFADKLASTKLPRNSKAIQASPELQRMLKYKVAQGAENKARKSMADAGLDVDNMPEEVQATARGMVSNMDTLITKMPDEIPTVMPMWVDTYPEYFEKDEFGRIDDVVPASKRASAAVAIRKNGRYGKGKSTHDMINELDELHSTGKYYG